MMHTIITRRKLKAWGACYSPERIRALIPAAGLTPLQILDLDIPAADRLWVVLRKNVISERDLRLLACLWAELALGAQPSERVDQRSRDAIRIARSFAAGEATREQLEQARAAAWAAAAEAAESAAARAAEAAAWAAARAAWEAAAWAAAARAAEAADRKRLELIEDVRRVLSGGAP